MNNKLEKTQRDIARIWSKPDESSNELFSKPRQSSENPLLMPESLETFGSDDEAGEPIIEKILNRQEILQIFAPSGVGKSIYTDNIIASLLAGDTLFGEFKVTEPQDVYLCEFEMSSYERGERLRSIAQKSGAHFYAKNLMYEGYKLNNPAHFANFAEAMRHFKPTVIVIDPWKAAHSVDENNSSEIEPILSNIRRLMYEINGSVIIVHHAGRDFVTRDGERIPRHGRGTTVLDDRSDVIWEIEETNDQDFTILRRRKMRGLRKEMAKEYKIQFDRITGICVSVSKRGEYADFIRRKRTEMKLTQEEFAEYLGVNSRTVRRWEAGTYNPPEEAITRLHEA
jgi:DNA-binding transcriptional regulator YiaG